MAVAVRLADRGFRQAANTHIIEMPHAEEDCAYLLSARAALYCDMRRCWHTVLRNLAKSVGRMYR